MCELAAETDINLVIAGDTCPVGRPGRLLARGDAAAVFASLLPELLAADLVIANLECPLVTERAPTRKSGPVLAASPDVLPGLKAANLGLLGLANNHIMDHGPEGLAATLDVLHTKGFDTVGAGPTLADAAALWVKSFGRTRVGVLGFAEAEYSLATAHHPGANSMDPVHVSRSVRSAREACDFLVVLLHAGNELLDMPRPGLRDFCRWLAEEGVQVVVCQHSHTVGLYEEYKAALLVYGQGDFLFDLPSEGHDRYSGMLVKLVVHQGGGFNHELIPYGANADGAGIERLGSAAAEDFTKRLEANSLAVLRDDAAYQRRWRDYCESRRYEYLSLVHGFPEPLRLLNRRGLLTRMLYSRAGLRIIGNLVRCESHREVLTTLAAIDLEREQR